VYLHDDWSTFHILADCLYLSQYFSDLADWLGVREDGLFNFKPSVRPVPLEVHIQVSGISVVNLNSLYDSITQLMPIFSSRVHFPHDVT
jgi:hypothetical protein